MGLLDKAKRMARQHHDKVDDAIDKAADLADDKSGGEHSDKIESAAEKAKEALDDLD